MININGNDYKLGLVDTNIVSEMVKNPSHEFNKFIELTLQNKIIPSFSIFTILELRQKRNVYEQFLEFFSIIPCIIVKSHEQLLANEFEAYPDPSGINPVLVASAGVADSENNTFKVLLDSVFKTPENIENEASWNAGKDNVIAGILDLRENFPPDNGKYSPKQIRAFIEMAGFEQIARRSPAFARNLLDKNEAVSIDAFPSLKMILFTVFYKFYVDNRKPSTSDTFDIIISAPTPYMDAVFTENHQAEVIKKTKRRDPFLNHLEVFRLQDLR